MTAAAAPRRPAQWAITSVWLATLVAAVTGVAVLLFLHRGDAEGSARLANREIEWMLERGETVQFRLPVMQRQWWDWFRVTHGVLAATNRRVIVVAVPVEPLLPRDEEPLELQQLALSYDRQVQADFGRAFLGTRPALRLTTDAGAWTFAFAAGDRERADSVVAVLTRRQAALRAAAEAERRAAEATVAASRRAIYHLVQWGEALETIARRYGVSADSIISWNSLRSPRISAGSRLLVKPGVP